MLFGVLPVPDSHLCCDFRSPPSRTRQGHGRDRERGGEAQREGEEDQEASDHLLQPAAPGAEPALPADPVPRPAREGRPGGQAGPDPNPGTVLGRSRPLLNVPDANPTGGSVLCSKARADLCHLSLVEQRVKLQLRQ